MLLNFKTHNQLPHIHKNWVHPIVMQADTCINIHTRNLRQTMTLGGCETRTDPVVKA